MKYRPLIPILITFLIKANASDAEYKFVVVEGEPVTLNASETVQVASFDECTDKCEQKTECVLAYQSNSSDPCYLFDWNSITQIIKNEAGGNGTTAFKVYTDQPACELNAAYLLNGKTYPMYPNDTTQDLWRIDTAEDGWTITYIDAKPSDNLICGNFTHNRPYKDGCDPECSITMVQLLAFPGPLTYYAPNLEPSLTTWNECLYYCHGNPNCLVVYFNPDLTPKCRWYSIDIIFFLNKTEASEMGGRHLALKTPLDDKSCKSTTEELMKHGQTYPVNPNDATKNSWRIDNFEDGYTINYIDTKPTDNLVCGNFKHARPYKDGCDPKCNITMVQLIAFPGPLTSRMNEEPNLATWDDCLNACQRHPSCLVTHYNPGLNPKCRWYSVDRIFFLNRTTANEFEGQHLALKLPMSQKSCLYTTEELVNDKYYYPGNKRINEFFKGTFFRIRTTPKYYKISIYTDETKDRGSTWTPAGCEAIYYPSVLGSEDQYSKNPMVCNRYKHAVLLHAAAKEICQEWDGELATERFYGFFSNCLSNVDHSSMPLEDLGLFWSQYGMIAPQVGLTVWVGLEKDNTTQQFKWAREDWVGTNGVRRNQCPYDQNSQFTMTSIPYTWDTNQPDMTPGNDCVYMTIKDTKTFPGYALSTSRCDTYAKGFACQTPAQKDKGIPKFDDILTEYGEDRSHLDATYVWG